jgi:hypothetical protein
MHIKADTLHPNNYISDIRSNTLSTPGKKTQQVNVRLSKGLLEKLDEAVPEKGRAELMRKALEQFLEPPPPPPPREATELPSLEGVGLLEILPDVFDFDYSTLLATEKEVWIHCKDFGDFLARFDHLLISTEK